MSKKKDENCGIYAIINKVNCKIYIGSSKRLKIRKYQHFYFLRKNTHANKILQNVYNKYGENILEWKILEYCTESNLLDRELFYINYYNSSNLNCGYNISLKPGITTMSEEGRNRVSVATHKRMIGNSWNKGKKRSEEFKRGVSEFHSGRKCSEETRVKIGSIRRGVKLSEETKSKIGKKKKGNKYWLGKKHTEESKEKIGIASKLNWEKRKCKKEV